MPQEQDALQASLSARSKLATSSLAQAGLSYPLLLNVFLDFHLDLGFQF